MFVKNTIHAPTEPYHVASVIISVSKPFDTQGDRRVIVSVRKLFDTQGDQ